MNDNGKPYYKPTDLETLRSSLILKGTFSAITKSSQEST